MISDIPSWKLWLPKSAKAKILRVNHDDKEAFHGGIKKTIEKIRRYYYWPTMARDVTEYINNCEVCKESKHSNKCQRPTAGKPILSERPFQKLYVDFMGPYPRTNSGKTVIFVILDQLTKFVILKALSRATSSLIIEYLSKEVFPIFNCPEKIYSDNGKQFTSHEFLDFLKEYGITPEKTAIYSPQSNASERVNRSVLAAIRSSVDKDHKSWDKYLPSIAGALRDAIHSTTKFSPHYSLFGYHKIVNGEQYKLLRDLKALECPEIETLPNDLRISAIHKSIRENFEKAFQTYIRPYNLRTRQPNYNPGTIVWVRTHQLSNKANKFIGKFAPIYEKMILKEKLGQGRYLVTDLHKQNSKVVHAQDMKH